jgi:hypothetical protein
MRAKRWIVVVLLLLFGASVGGLFLNRILDVVFPLAYSFSGIFGALIAGILIVVLVLFIMVLLVIWVAKKFLRRDV